LSRLTGVSFLQPFIEGKKTHTERKKKKTQQQQQNPNIPPHHIPKSIVVGVWGGVGVCFSFFSFFLFFSQCCGGG